MYQYRDLVTDVLRSGEYKPNRTGVDTISSFSQHYTVNLRDGFPLLTTKDLSGSRWNSLLSEFIWYLSGEEHIRSLREDTSIWDAWADDDGRLETAYGRFWRRYPIPSADSQLPGEAWPVEDHRWQNDDGTFDQLAYAIDQLQKNPHSRRIVVSAWHPANAAVSTLPPCHYTFVFNVQNNRLNVHLTQRSGDIALGIPFNIAAYSLLATVVAKQTGLTPGTFAHSIVDAHIYCGTGNRGAWYSEEDTIKSLQARLDAVDDPAEYRDIREWLIESAPSEPSDGSGYDHIPGLLEQCAREPRSKPRIEIDDVSLDNLGVEHIQLSGYDPEPAIRFAVAE
jgi:thymidylate synthase